MLLFAFALLADTTATEPEKWIGPILTSVVNLAATYFAFMTARDRLKYDANSTITASRLKTLEAEASQCQKDSKQLRRRLNRVVANLQAQMMNRPLPFPGEMGFSEDIDPNEPPKQV